MFNVITGFSGRITARSASRTRTCWTSAGAQIVARGIARTFQNLRLFDELTALDNVMVCLEGRVRQQRARRDVPPVLDARGAPGQDAKSAPAICTQVGLGHKAQRPGAQL